MSVFERADKANGPVECTEEDWYYALEVLPPERYLRKGFIMGEPVTEDYWYCFWKFNGKFWCWLTDITTAVAVTDINDNGVFYDPKLCQSR